MSFVEVTGDKYTQLLIWRLSADAPELTWVKQCRDILSPYLYPGVTLLDIGVLPDTLIRVSASTM